MRINLPQPFFSDKSYNRLHNKSNYVTKENGLRTVFMVTVSPPSHIKITKNAGNSPVSFGVDFRFVLWYSFFRKAVTKTRQDIICSERRLYAEMALQFLFPVTPLPSRGEEMPRRVRPLRRQ